MKTRLPKTETHAGRRRAKAVGPASLVLGLAACLVCAPQKDKGLLAAESPRGTNTPANVTVLSTNTATTAGQPPKLLGLFPRKPKVVKPPPPLKLTPKGDRISDFAIANDLRFFNELQQRLDNAATKLGSTNLYQVAKAGAWLELARGEHLLSDRSGIIEAAVAQTTNLLGQLTSEAPTFRAAAPLPPMANRIRPDLWQLAEELRGQTNFAGNEETVARLEVQLVWAGHREWQDGWRAALPYLLRAEQLAAKARATAPSQGEHQGATPTPQKARPANGGQGTPAKLDGLQARLAAVNASGVPLTNYFLAKAQHWLDFARGEYQANDHSGVVEDAAKQAESLIPQLEDHSTNASLETPLLKRSAKVRDDLWQLAADLKQRTNFVCGADCVARLEVQLVWAGYEHRSLGWRNARPYVQAAERFAKEAKARIEGEPMPPAGLGLALEKPSPAQPTGAASRLSGGSQVAPAEPRPAADGGSALPEPTPKPSKPEGPP